MCKNITVIIPMYNSEKTIEQAVNSVLNQSDNCEIILIDDGSTDDTVKIAKKIRSGREHRIKLYEQDNGGASSARNTGIAYCNTKYLCFLDSDDEQQPGFLALFERYAEINQVDCVIGKIEYNNKKNEKLTEKTYLIEGRTQVTKSVPRLIEGQIFNSLVNKIYRTDIIKKNNLILNEKLSIGEDFDFNLKYIKFCENIFIVDRYIYLYRTENSYLTKITRINEFNNRVGNINSLKEFYKNNEIEINLDFQYIKIFYSELYNEFSQNNTKHEIKKRIRVLLENKHLQEIKLEEQGVIKLLLTRPVLKRNIELIYIVAKLSYYVKDIDFLKKNQYSI